MTERHPHRRTSDKPNRSYTHRRSGDSRLGFISVRENWYRDVWLVIITLTVGYLAAISATQSTKARNLARAIQHERVASIRDSCVEQNQRHDGTISELYRLAARIERTHPDKSAEVRQGIQQNILLIDQLAPRQNCTVAVRRATTN